jgi:hypothetical protein
LKSVCFRDYPCSLPNFNNRRADETNNVTGNDLADAAYKVLRLSQRPTRGGFNKQKFQASSFGWIPRRRIFSHTVFRVMPSASAVWLMCQP